MTRKPRYGLSQKYMHEDSRELMDYDYLRKLTDEELDWLDKFSREYYNEDFTHQENVHPPTYKLRITAARNFRRRDFWTKERVDLSLENMAYYAPQQSKF